MKNRTFSEQIRTNFKETPRSAIKPNKSCGIRNYDLKAVKSIEALGTILEDCCCKNHNMKQYSENVAKHGAVTISFDPFKSLAFTM